MKGYGALWAAADLIYLVPTAMLLFNMLCCAATICFQMPQDCEVMNFLLLECGGAQ